MKPKILKIFGPPGTGKTHALLEKVKERVIENQVDISQIGYFSFTRIAKREGLIRGSEALGISLDKLKSSFRTLHSYAIDNKIAPLGNLKAMTPADYEEFSAEKISPHLPGIKLKVASIDEGTMYTNSPHLQIRERAIAKCITLKEEFDQRNHTVYVNWSDVERINDDLEMWKIDNGRVEFSDFIIRAINMGINPPEGFTFPSLDSVYIDEAQDLTPLLWKFVDLLIKNSKHAFIAGDDDQAIYHWSGGDVNLFINHDGEDIILRQSRRLPRQILDLSKVTINKIRGNRKEKEFSPRKDPTTNKEVPGNIFYRANSDFKFSEGTWLVMGRTREIIKPFAKGLRALGVFYSFMGNLPKGVQGALEVLKNWEKLMKGESISHEAVLKVYSLIKSKKKNSSENGIEYRLKTEFKKFDKNKLYSLSHLKEQGGLHINTDKPWYEIFNMIEEETSRYIQALQKKGEDLTKDPRIRVATFHSSKGAEADHSIVSLSFNSLPLKTFQESPSIQRRDEEVRVFYVGTTRSKYNLYFLRPENSSESYSREFFDNQLENIIATIRSRSLGEDEK